MLTSKKIKYFFQVLGPIIFIYILFQIDFGLLKKELLNINVFYLLLAACFVVIQIITRAQKWRIILLGAGINISRINSISLYWLGTFIGVITPGRFGELIKVYFLRNKGYSTFRSFLSVLFDRLSDILTLLLLGFLIFAFFLREIGIYVFLISIILLLFLIFVFLLINKKSFLHKIFFKILKKFFSDNLEEYENFSFAKFLQSLKKTKKSFILSFLFYLLVSWFLYFIARYFIVLSIDLNLSFLEVSVISILVAVVTMLPISIAGIGTREITVIYLFGLFSLSKEMALIFSLLVFTIDILIVSLGLIPYLKESRLISKIKRT